MIDEVIKLEQELKAIKTIQRTSIDSFRYFFFTSGDVFSEVKQKTWDFRKKITFVPKNAKFGEYICRFFCFSPGQYTISISQYPDSYNQAYVSCSGYSEESFEASLDFAYFGCITTTDGFVKIEDTNEGA